MSARRSPPRARKRRVSTVARALAARLTRALTAGLSRARDIGLSRALVARPGRARAARLRTTLDVGLTRALTAALTRALAAGLCLALAAACARERPGMPPAHVLVISFENLRADGLSCYQHLAPTSAFASTLEERLDSRAFGFDELARTGVVFERAYASSSATAPSLAALLTGRSPIETGVIGADDELAESERTFASELRARGFATAAFVSDGGGALARRVARGFDTVITRADDEATFAAALRWLARDTGAGQPTCVWIHLAGLALPWDSPLAPSYAGSVLPEPVSALADGSTDCLARVASGALALGPAERAELGVRYDLRVRATLEGLQTFLRAAYDWTTSPVEASETWDRTWLVLCGANGLELGEHGALAPEYSPHEEALRVPLVVRHPDSVTGERVFAPIVTLEDVAPTLLRVCGVDVPADVDGRSLLGVVDRASPEPFVRRPAIAVLPGTLYSVRGERWRVLWNRWNEPARAGVAHAVPGVAAFDHAVDPLERSDCAADAPAAVEWGAVEIERWRAERAAFRPGR